MRCLMSPQSTRTCVTEELHRKTHPHRPSPEAEATHRRFSPEDRTVTGEALLWCLMGPLSTTQSVNQELTNPRMIGVFFRRLATLGLA